MIVNVPPKDYLRNCFDTSDGVMSHIPLNFISKHDCMYLTVNWIIGMFTASMCEGTCASIEIELNLANVCAVCDYRGMDAFMAE